MFQTNLNTRFELLPFAAGRIARGEAVGCGGAAKKNVHQKQRAASQ